MTTALVDIIYLSTEKIIGIAGERSTGVSPRDKAIFSMLEDKLARVKTIQKNLSWNQLRKMSNGHVFSSGGAPNMYSMLAQYPTITKKIQKEPNKVYPFTLEDMAQAIKNQPKNPPIRWIYHTPVLETLQTADRNLEKLMQIMGIKNIEDYEKLQFFPDVPEIGYLQTYKDLGITEPHWRVQKTAVSQSSQQKPLTLPAQEKPFVEGYDPFLILAGANFVNPEYNMMVFVGGRGPATFAAELVAIGKDRVSRQELDKAGLENASCYIDLPNTTHNIEGVQHFLDKVSKKLKENLAPLHYGYGFKGDYRNVAILGMVHTIGNLPLSVSGPIDIEFYNPIFNPKPF